MLHDVSVPASFTLVSFTTTETLTFTGSQSASRPAGQLALGPFAGLVIVMSAFRSRFFNVWAESSSGFMGLSSEY
jgi:hypothetical protein